METESLVKVYICRSEKHSWDTIWKWSWFTRKSWEQQYWKEIEKALKPLFQLLQKLSVGSILDCSCGLGFKTIMLAKMGYEVEGSDASKVAIKYAPKFAKEHGLILKFFHSRFEDLSENCNRKYDCIFSDYFDELRTRRALEKSAMGIYSVLKDHGKFIFCSVPPELTKAELKNLIDREWRKRKLFNVDPPVEQDGLKVIRIEVAEKTLEGILEKNIYLIEERGLLKAEIAPMMNPRIKWTFQDFVEVLGKAGFRRIDHVPRKKEETLVIASK